MFCKLVGPKCVLQVSGTKMCSANQIIKRNLWLMQRMKAQTMLSDYYQVQICWVIHNAHAQVKINKNFQRKIVNIFLPINFNIGFGCSKEPSH